MLLYDYLKTAQISTDIKSGGIYAILCIGNDKVYVGKTTCFNRRWIQHLKDLRKGIHYNCHLQRTYSKYGGDSFCFFILEKVEEERLTEREIHFSSLLSKDHELMNLREVGDGFPITKECRENRSRIMKNDPNLMLKIRNMNEARLSKGFTVWIGRKHTEESKKKMSESKKLYYKDNPQKLSKEHLEALNAGRRAYKITEETKQRIAKTLTGRKIPQEVKDKIKATRAAKMAVDPNCYKKTISLETRAKMSIAQILYREKQKKKKKRNNKKRENVNVTS